MAMSNQEIFDRVATHLLTQGRQSTSGYGSDNCLYRGNGGDKCAVGALIADQYYSGHIEGRRTDSRDVIRALVSSGVLDGNHSDDDFRRLNLLCDLQMVHDRTPPSSWKGALHEVAYRHNLHSNRMGRRHPQQLEQVWLDDMFMPPTVLEVRIDPVTGWRTPIYTPLSPLSVYYESAQAETDAKAAIKKAQTVERKDLTPLPELVI